MNRSKLVQWTIEIIDRYNKDKKSVSSRGLHSPEKIKEEFTREEKKLSSDCPAKERETYKNYPIMYKTMHSKLTSKRNNYIV